MTRRRFTLLPVICLFGLSLNTANGSPPQADPNAANTHIPGWDLVWQDEFDGPQINRENWSHETGGHGWGNRELQYYTDRPDNAYLDNGHLVIIALEEKFQRRRYTSARLMSRGKVEFTYGRVEARMKLPQGKGLWPAFWMLGANFPDVGWPDSGEIDIMENIGSEPSVIHGTVHGPGYSKNDGVGASRTLPGGEHYADSFHVFAVEWSQKDIQWSVDGEVYLHLTPDDVPGDWVFDHPFYLILNLAVGGKWPGRPDRSTAFPQILQIDYVRLYKRVSLPALP